MGRLESFFLSLLLAWTVWVAQGGDGVPSFTPVDSPFPAESSWLLVTSEAGDFSGAEGAMNAKDLRDAIENEKLFDYDQNVAEEPWASAKARAEAAAGGKPYFLFRSGSRAAEGLLEGSMVDMHETLKKAAGVE